MVDIRARGDLSTDERDFLVRQVENRVLGMPEVEFLYAKTGSSDQGAEDLIGSLTLNYIDWDKRRRADDILAEVRERTNDLVGIRIETRKPDAGPPMGKPISIEFSSRFPDELYAAVARVREHMAMNESHCECRRQPAITRNRMANPGRSCRGRAFRSRYIARRCDGAARNQRYQDRGISP